MNRWICSATIALPIPVSPRMRPVALVDDRRVSLS
jgi:hypothetical protein